MAAFRIYYIIYITMKKGKEVCFVYSHEFNGEFYVKVEDFKEMMERLISIREENRKLKEKRVVLIKEEKKSEYIATPDDIKRVMNGIDYREATNLPFGIEAFYNTDNHLSLYGKDFEITKVTLSNLGEANSLVFGVIEAFRQIQSQMFNLGIIE